MVPSFKGSLCLCPHGEGVADMSRKSKKGFKKLENHELVSFQQGDSGSESELLDLSTEAEPTGRVSCCWWCSCLYLGMLTCLVLLLGAFAAYIALNLRQLSDELDQTHSTLDSRINDLQSSLDRLKSNCDGRFMSFEEKLKVLNGSLQRIENAAGRNHTHAMGVVEQLSSSYQNLDGRLRVIESKPQETLIRQVEAIHQEMGTLNHNMLLLNHSLSDVNMIKERMASTGSQISQYDARLREINRNFGDLQLSHTNLTNRIDKMKTDIAVVKTEVGQLRDTITTAHDQMQQSTELLSAQFANVQVLMSAMNDSMREETEELWANITEIESDLAVVRRNVTAVRQELQSHTAEVMELLETKLSATALPPLTTPPSTPLSTSPSTSPPQKVQTTEPPTTVSPHTTEEVAPSEQTVSPPTEPPSSSDNITPSTEVPHNAITEPSATGSLADATGEPVTPGTDSTGATEDNPEKNRLGKNETTSTGTDEDATASSLPDSTLATEDHPVSNPLSVTATDSFPEAQNTTNASNATVASTVKVSNSENITGRVNGAKAGKTNSSSQAVSVLQSMLRIYDKLDVDGNGKLDRFEFPSQASGVFNLLDLNRDRYVTVEEIEDMIQRLEARATQTNINNEGAVDSEEGIKTPSSFDDNF